jgi:hypothetical protein
MRIGSEVTLRAKRSIRFWKVALKSKAFERIVDQCERGTFCIFNINILCLSGLTLSQIDLT